ncbi:hypothetical protein L211DRAFT_871414 [Terfezia boudieri ATCC MYA-4762]|uniref:Uncharacterized protein n=1 Tax=Terfezia boudieri ATCC MYA-4762 TaxID=1051890 RepID=A0A3N4L8P8_9PEZI|nr:hypothetical protein L211DRAFT_871414 [Terfezia boudieri ATCC MYA-4762]
MSAATSASASDTAASQRQGINGNLSDGSMRVYQKGGRLEQNESTVRNFLKGYEENDQNPDNAIHSDRSPKITKTTVDKNLEIIIGDPSIQQLALQQNEAEELVEVHSRTLSRYLKGKEYWEWIGPQSSPSGASQSVSSLDSVGILKPSTESAITPLPRAYVQSYHPQQNFPEDTAFFSSQEALLGRPEHSSRDSIVSFQTLEKADGDGVQVPSAPYYASENEYFLDIYRNAYCEPPMKYTDFDRKTRIIWSSRMKLKADLKSLCLRSGLAIILGAIFVLPLVIPLIKHPLSQPEDMSMDHGGDSGDLDSRVIILSIHNEISFNSNNDGDDEPLLT